MKEITCKKCKSRDLFLRESGSATGLYCADCGVWQKWVRKKELPLVEHCLEAQKEAKTPDATFLDIWNRIRADGTLREPFTPAGIPLLRRMATGS